MLQRIRRRRARRADDLNGSVLLQVRFQEDIAPATRATRGARVNKNCVPPSARARSRDSREPGGEERNYPRPSIRSAGFTTGLRRGAAAVTQMWHAAGFPTREGAHTRPDNASARQPSGRAGPAGAHDQSSRDLLLPPQPRSQLQLGRVQNHSSLAGTNDGDLSLARRCFLIGGRATGWVDTLQRI